MAERTYTVYVLFSRSTTMPSRLIHLLAGGAYTHVSLGLDSPKGPYHTFARKGPRLPLPAGLVQEMPGRGFFGLHPNIPCCLFALEVSEEVYRSLTEKLEEMYRQQEKYHYNVLGAITAYFYLPLRRHWHYFCSQFVAEVLSESGAVTLAREPDLARPMDIYALMGREEPVMEGVIGDLAG